MRLRLPKLCPDPAPAGTRSAPFRPKALARLRPSALTVIAGALLVATSSHAQTEIKYHWMRQFYGQIGGTEMLLYSDSFRHGKLTFGDLDGDGRAEMLIGTEDGRVARFDNVGTPDAPVWKLTEESLQASIPERGGQARGAQRPIHVNGFAAPALVDLDGDGDLDLVVGSADGVVAYYRNVGTPLLPSFELANPELVPKGLGTYLVPFAEDVDGDRAPDLLVGTAEGDVYLLMNSGVRREPVFCARLPDPDAPDEDPPCQPVPRVVASIKPDIHAAPALADWSGDGKPDLFIGEANGTIAYYESRGGRHSPVWTLTQPKFLAIDEGGYAAPGFFQTPRGRPDLYVGSSTNNVSLYSNRDTTAPLDAWRVTGNALRIGRFGREQERLVATAGDVDGDGDIDLLVGDRSGAVWWVENVGTAKVPSWRVRPDPIVPESARGYAAPLLVDLDGDGDLDLLVGGGDGRLWLLRNSGTPKQPRWQMETTSFANIDVGGNSVPAVTDIDGDGDLDLFVGNSRGLVIYYRNEGTAKEPDFRLVSTRFGDATVGQAAAPAFFDWNDDKLPDLVIGNREGRLALLVNDNAGETQPRKWKTQSTTWEGIQVRTYSVPVFADFNGDGKPDLLVTDGQGNLRLYLNGGFDKPPEPTPPPPPPVETPAPAANPPRGGVARQVAPPVPRPGSAATPKSAGPRTAPAVNSPNAPPVAPQRGAPSAPGAPANSARPGAMAPKGAAPGTSSRGNALSNDLNKGDLAPAAASDLQGESQGEGDTGPGPLPPSFQLDTDKYAGIQVEGRASPAFGDLDGDGDLDLLVGTGKGQVLYFRNTGTKQQAKWEAVTEPLLDTAPGRNASLLLADVDGDGLLDLLVGNEDGRVLYYKNVGATDHPQFKLQPDAFANVIVGRNAAPALLPSGKDPVGRLLVGSFSGSVFLYSHEGPSPAVNYKLLDRRFLGRSFGVSATPFAIDMDHDGMLDLIVGSDNGSIAHYAESPAPKAAWKPAENYFKDLKLPLGSTPRLADIDGDGNLDLFVGSEKGTILFYANRAGAGDSGEGK